MSAMIRAGLIVLDDYPVCLLSTGPTEVGVGRVYQFATKLNFGKVEEERLSP